MALFPKHSPLPSFHAKPAQQPPQQVPSATSAGALLKRYVPLGTRATGGFGSVEICRDTRLQRRVAIKRMPLTGSAQPGAYIPTAVEAALAEARTASMLQHPNIVPVIDFGFDSTYAYLVMEYVDGMSLEEFLQRVDGNSLTYDEAAAIADALGQALSFAHENGVLHLDIKPGNVLIDRNGNIKLTDFGMATLSRAAGFGGARGGTLGYMPPEQLDVETDGIDARTDVFALGAVLYEALCATRPFYAATPSASLDRIIKGVVYPSDLLPDIPPATEEALVEALSPMPQDRPASIAAFCERFCAQLGNPRAGQKSLAHMIEEITYAAETEDEETPPENSWELDPEKGYLGSQFDKARPYALAALSGIGAAVVSYRLLAAVGMLSQAGALATALAIGAAAALAPQVGAALVATGFTVSCANATVGSAGVLASLPVPVVFCALVAGWWLTWGRTERAASAIFCCAGAIAAASGNPIGFMGISVALSAFALSPAAGALTCLCASLFGLLLNLAAANSGSVAAGLAQEALLQPAALAAIALSAAGAGLACIAANFRRKRAWERGGQGSPLIPAIVCAIVGFLLFCLARPMEIAQLEPAATASAIGVGLVSSIIFWICDYLLGFTPGYTEGDRS